MDRGDLSAPIIQEMGTVFMTTLAEALPALLGADLAQIEQHLQQVGRTVFGRVVEQGLRLQAAAVEEERPPCAACGGRLQRVDRARPRHL
ncbi:MAG TPA: hypothetical protein VKF37_13035, partial [Chloroflexota bacterium]|nr:hypothetical protein [Chloroflexota bacterium]